MRGVGNTLSCLPAARAFIAGAAILAGSIPTAGNLRAQAAGEDTALANPRIGPDGLDGAGLPQVLAPSDAVRLRRIFSLQEAGAMADASAEIDELATPLLTGHVLAQRYLGRFVQASSAELATWLARYPDHPDAAAVHALLLSRLAPGASAPPAPDLAALTPQAPASPTPEENTAAAARLPRNPLLDRTVHERAHAGNADSALRLLSRTRGLDAIYGGQLRAEVAQALFSQGRDELALRLAEGALRQSGGRVGLAAYVAGLAAWRLQRPTEAQLLFEAAYRADIASPSLQAGAAFWAARAHLHDRDFNAFVPWMRRAAEARHTFYGLLARRSLGFAPNTDPGRDTLGSADVDALMASPHGQRAFALLQVGQPRRAEAELRLLWPEAEGHAGLSNAVMRVAEAAGLTDLAAQLAGLIEASEGRPHDDARFPIPALRPAGGFKVDPALVYALTRLESNFDPDAVSSVGARGLMQVMPVTASYMAGDGGTQLGRYARRLHDPAANLAIGQSYVIYLSERDDVNGDLIRLLGSYNAGPASFARMQAAMAEASDPLLFIESIPNDETRGFVPRALAYSWIYAARLHLPTPSLDAMAAGEWPSFQNGPGRRDGAARLH